MISICIPVYNQGEYLNDAIDSALAQTVKAEVIVCNDGSTDHSLEIARKYEGIKVIDQVNKGLSSARNTLIMNATGDYILFLDADDILKENAVERIEQAIKDTGSDVIGPSFKTFGLIEKEVILGGAPTLEDFKTGNRLGYFSAIKRSVLLEVGGYSPKMAEGWEDFHLWFDIFKRGHTLTVLSDVLVLYRTKETSMYTESVKHSDKLWGQIKRDHKLWS